MVKAIPALLLMLLATAVYADSDSTGAIAGTTERLVIGLANSTGHFDPSANCSIRILFGSDLSVNYSYLSSMGNGNYYYDWSVPSDVGVYNMFFNCTTPANENYTAGGSVYVVTKPFQKSVAQGIEKYGPQYAPTYNPNWWDNNNNKIVAVALIILMVGFGMYIYDNYGARLGR